MGKIRLTQFMPKVWEKLQTCVQHRRGGNWGKKSELWLGKGVVNNPSKAWDIWYAVQCERSKVKTNWVGANHPWAVAGGAGFSHTCTIPVVQSWQSLALRGIRIHHVVAPMVVHDSHIYFQIQGHFFAISLGRRDKTTNPETFVELFSSICRLEVE
jgi:hypothetical protein